MALDFNSIQFLINIICVLFVGLISILFVSIIYGIIYLIGKLRTRGEKISPAEDPLIKDLNRLNKILNEAQEIIPKISEDIAKKHKIVKSLKSDYELYQNIPQFSKENLEAFINNEN